MRDLTIRYSRAYLDFFEDEVVRSNYDWKRVVQRYVAEGDEPLLSGMISGGSRPSMVPDSDGSVPSVDPFGICL
jgi:hypothetical protein